MTQATSSIKFEGIATALSAISHLGDSLGGTTSIFRRVKKLVNGTVLDIPAISGNSFRGLLRDRGMFYMLRELGYAEDQAVKLSVPAFHFLTSGGALTKDGGRGIDMGEQRRLRELIPLVAVFGGATGRAIMPGKLQVGEWLPICRETRAFVPEQYHTLPEAQLSIFDMTDVQSFTRTDDAKNPRWQPFLPEAQRELLTAPKVKVAKDGTEVAEKPGVAQQMRYGMEVMIAGTKWYCWLQLSDVTDLEYEAFASALVEWSKAPFVGGQSRHGLGLVELTFDNWMSVSPLARADAAGIGRPLGTAYNDHLHSRKDEILAALKEIA